MSGTALRVDEFFCLPLSGTSVSLYRLSRSLDAVAGRIYFLGLRPLAGYASLKLYHVMSCFLHEKRSVCYDMAG